MKMKKTDIGVVAFMYAVCAFFYVYSFDLSDSSKSYPRFTIMLLFGLTTLYLIQMVIKARKYGVESGVDEIFEGFQVKQFFVSLALVIVYFLMMKYLGFFSATIIYLVAALVYLRVPVLHSVITVVGVNVMIYLAFVMFLGVKLPKGLLF
ncbi:MAG: tripartite tricarboxylate transporter TctB family protein [Oscillospiraceae bacterium]|nr:tripartite tricarboxylate transporter TctB family protein [Oscillospiraceae bacterium]